MSECQGRRFGSSPDQHSPRALLKPGPHFDSSQPGLPCSFSVLGDSRHFLHHFQSHFFITLSRKAPRLPCKPLFVQIQPHLTAPPHKQSSSKGLQELVGQAQHKSKAATSKVSGNCSQLEAS